MACSGLDVSAFVACKLSLQSCSWGWTAFSPLFCGPAQLLRDLLPMLPGRSAHLGVAERLPRLPCPSCVSIAARRRSPRSGAAADRPGDGGLSRGAPPPQPGKMAAARRPRDCGAGPASLGRAEGSAPSRVFCAGPGRAGVPNPERTRRMVVSGNAGDIPEAAFCYLLGTHFQLCNCLGIILFLTASVSSTLNGYSRTHL